MKRYPYLQAKTEPFLKQLHTKINEALFLVLVLAGIEVAMQEERLAMMPMRSASWNLARPIWKCDHAFLPAPSPLLSMLSEEAAWDWGAQGPEKSSIPLNSVLEGLARAPVDIPAMWLLGDMAYVSCRVYPWL